jgi:hypothetical protein
MQVQINTDKNVQGGAPLSAHVQTSLENRLGRFSERLTRVEAHISDENGQKSGGGVNDKRCLMEARPRGLQPVAVTHTAASIDLAVTGACDKLERLLDTTFGQMDNHRGRSPAN